MSELKKLAQAATSAHYKKIKLQPGERMQISRLMSAHTLGYLVGAKMIIEKLKYEMQRLVEIEDDEE